MRIEPELAAQSEHSRRCDECGDAFVARADSAYCSNRCRQAAYRKRTYRADTFDANGWPRQSGDPLRGTYPTLCWHRPRGSRSCMAVATWKVERLNARRGHTVTFWCADHRPDVEPGVIYVDKLRAPGRSTRKQAHN